MYRRSSQFFPGLVLGALLALAAVYVTKGSDAVIGHTAHLLTERHAAPDSAVQGPRCGAACCSHFHADPGGH